MSASELPGTTSVHISSSEANNWWRKNQASGAFLNKLMVGFIVAPIALVYKDLFAWSLIVFLLMAPYGLLVRRLAVSAVRKHLVEHPESEEELRDSGVLG